MHRVKIAVLGLNFGRYIVDEILSPRANTLFELAAVCDLDPARLGPVAEKTGVSAFSDLDALLAREDIPVIGLFTGPAGRTALIRRLIDAGKHVLTTKPFEVDPAAALGILREARAKKRILHLNSPGPLVPPDLAQIRSWQEEFDLGRPVACRADVWANCKERSDGGWMDDSERCPVAPIFRVGIYLINDLVALFGEADCVQVLHSRLFTGRPTPDNAQLGIRFKSGALANIFASFCVNDGQHYSNALTLNYENGTIYRNVGRLPFGGGQLSLATCHDQTEPRVARAELPADAHSGTYQWEALYRAVSGEEFENETSPEQIVAGLKIIAAMARAEKSGGTESV